ncbi:hypothetical protein BH11ACT7_BH11ACT7_13320 [soil metagenome]
MGTIPKVVAVAAVAVGCVVACSTTVDGSPRAEPGRSVEVDIPPSTSRPPSSTTPRSAPTVPPVPTRTATPGAGADTTCDEYIDLDEDGQREVIAAIGQDNDLVALNPELWITLTSALCTFAEPSTPVREVLEGQGIR